MLYDCTNASWTHLALETTEMCYCEQGALYSGMKCLVDVNGSYNPKQLQRRNHEIMMAREITEQHVF